MQDTVLIRILLFGLVLSGANLLNVAVATDASSLRLYVANSLAESGVVDWLLGDFHRRHSDVQVSVQVAGALEVLEQARQGQADIVLTHIPAAEKLFIEEGFGLERVMVMYNEFVFYGPAGHELVRRLEGERDLRVALTELAVNEVAFIVPSPRSGTYAKLAELWAMMGINPNWLGYESIHASATTTIETAASQEAFTFADNATYLINAKQLAGRLVPVIRDHLSLRNYYSVITINDRKFSGINRAAAERFRDYLISDSGQARIFAFNEHKGINLVMPAVHLDHGFRANRAERELRRQAYVSRLALALAIVLTVFLLTAFVLWRRAAALEKMRRASEERFSLAIAGSNDGIWDWDIALNQLYVSPRLLEQFGFTHQPAAAHDPIAIFAQAMDEEAQHSLRAQIERYLASLDKEPFVAEFKIKENAVDRPVWMMVRGKALFGDDGRARRMCGSVTEITNDKLKDVFEYRALHDSLTGLPNRALLTDRIKQTLFAIERHNETYALAMIDLDKFKQVNDRYGHQAGDTVLREIAKRLRNTLRRTDTLARLGGDEFFAILPHADAEAALLIADKILQHLREPVLFEDKSMVIGASIGLVIVPLHGRDSDDLMSKADAAMYKAKTQASGIVLYEADVEKQRSA